MSLREPNELVILLKKLKTKGISAKKVAERILYGYNTLRTEKTKKIPSQYIVDEIKSVYADVLNIKLAKEPSENPPVDTPLTENAFREDAARYSTIQQSLDKCLKNQERIDQKQNIILNAYNKAIAYIAEKDANGDEKKKKEILERLSLDLMFSQQE